jgi:prevent-host-death family protein
MVDAMKEISVGDLRLHLADILNETAYTGARTVITRAGKRIAAVVPVHEAEMLEEAEDAYLNRLADEAEAAQGNEPYASLADVLADYKEKYGEEIA